MKESIYPANIYKVVNRSMVTDIEKDILINLYQPIIGRDSISLYLTLLNDLGSNLYESIEYTHQHLLTVMMIGPDELISSRKKLEAVGLLKTYLKTSSNNSYIYLLFAPLSANEFINHPILNAILYNNLGKVEYDKIISKYRVSKISIKDYNDITASFDDIFSIINGYSFEEEKIVSKVKRNLIINNNIDVNLIVDGIPKQMVNPKCFSKEIIDLIINLAYLYRIDNMEMLGIVRNSINEKGMINKDDLKNNCRNHYQFENNGKLPTLIYNRQPEYLKEAVGSNSKIDKAINTFETLSPVEYLKLNYNGAEPTDRDKKLIEKLMVDTKLYPGVINVLIDYVLKMNNMKLAKEYIETIAGQWKRLNIETVKDAMAQCKKEYKKISNKKSNTNFEPKKKVVETPAWFNEKDNFKKNTSNTEEIEDLLKDF